MKDFSFDRPPASGPNRLIHLLHQADGLTQRTVITSNRRAHAPLLYFNPLFRIASVSHHIGTEPIQSPPHQRTRHFCHMMSI